MKKQLLTILTVVTITATAQIPSYVPTAGLIAYYGFNGNANDLSGNGNNGTITGATLTSDRFSTPNAAYNFATSGSKIDLFNNSTWLGSNDRTISFWLNTAYTGNDMYILSERPSCLGGSEQFFEFKVIGSNQIQFVQGNGYSLQASFIPNVWNHILFLKNGNTYQLYINGVLGNSTTGVYSTLPNTILGFSSTSACIANFGQNNLRFIGSADDLGIWNRALTATEIASLYSATSCTADITSGLFASYPFNGNANDASGNSINGVVTGATLTTDRFGNANSSYSFNGSSNYISATSTVAINTNTISGLTISGWCNLNSLTNISTICSFWDASDNSVYGLIYDNSVNKLTGLNGVNGSAATMYIQDLNTPNLGSWYNVVLTCDYATNTSILYVNGVFKSQSSSVLNRPTLNKINIGAWWQNSVWFANGKLDDIKVYSRALSACDVNGLFNEPNPLSTVVSEEQILNTITVFPNPVKDILKISVVNKTKINLISIYGQSVIETLIDPGTTNVDMSNLSSGIDVVSVGNTITKLIKE